MNLYLISQNRNNDYDTHDTAVVCAESEDDARRLVAWALGLDKWPVDTVEVKFLGTADPSVEPGVVLASFNAG